MTAPGSSRVIAEREFDLADQHWFGQMSGDVNPMHVDPIRARRTLYGQPVVHGVHVALWVLESLCVQRSLPISRIAVTFSKPVFLDEKLQVLLSEPDQHSSHLSVVIGTSVLTTIRIDHATSTVATLRQSDLADPDQATHVETPEDLTAPTDLDVDDLVGLRGALTVPGSVGEWSTSFPHLAALIGGHTVAELASLSTIVGMRCPGMHSVFAGFDVHVDARRDSDVRQNAQTGFAVRRANTRFFAVKIAVAASRMSGELSTFVRPRPTSQPTMDELSTLVAPDEFTGMRALVVGGSRGLGEVTAKLVAAGGGHPTISWHRGRDDAQEVARDIQSAGRRVSLVQLNVEDEHISFDGVSDQTHLFYFASPRITSRRLVAFDRELFGHFCDAYVHGFLRVANGLVEAGSTELRVFYPSSVFVDAGSADTAEYAAAKAAGEIVATRWAAALDGPCVHIERLPPLATDQTAGVVRAATADPTSTMLAALRRAADIIEDTAP